MATCAILKLSADPSDGLVFPDRCIRLDRQQNTVQIGRASKISAKGFVAQPENGWFDSPVMSRTHAVVTADLDNQTVEISDCGSLHGTFLNGESDRLPIGEPQQLHDGDRLVFGLEIFRNGEAFNPVNVTVGVDFETSDSAAAAPPVTGSTFRVPDEEDDLSDDCREIPKPTRQEGAPYCTKGPGERPAEPDVVDITGGVYASPSKSASSSTSYVIDLTDPSGTVIDLTDVVVTASTGTKRPAAVEASPTYEDRCDEDTDSNSSVNLSSRISDGGLSDENSSDSGSADRSESEESLAMAFRGFQEEGYDFEEEYTSSDDDNDFEPYPQEEPFYPEAEDEGAESVNGEDVGDGDGEHGEVGDENGKDLELEPMDVEGRNVGEPCHVVSVEEDGGPHYRASPGEVDQPIATSAPDSMPADEPATKQKDARSTHVESERDCDQHSNTAVHVGSVSYEVPSWTPSTPARTSEGDGHASHWAGFSPQAAPPPVAAEDLTAVGGVVMIDPSTFAKPAPQSLYEDWPSHFDVGSCDYLSAISPPAYTQPATVTVGNEPTEAWRRLAAKTGKFEYFKAREENKKIVLRSSSQAVGTVQTERSREASLIRGKSKDTVEPVDVAVDSPAASFSEQAVAGVEATGGPSTASRLKRKADEISEMLEAELPRLQERLARQRPERAAGGLPSPPSDGDVAPNVAVGSSSGSSDGARPVKRLRLRRIAEKLGYAALGGATVGAAIMTTLIYTAPTF
ncbi:hypothetical protein VTK73DRAFT_743 [Phialemonium thermophilum]|uniref:FHA domain-containing protein n=1 Tax=Phialemonium thermophilum TaxID=223376 RepID=A0ABR3VUE5_9PEZI